MKETPRGRHFQPQSFVRPAPPGNGGVRPPERNSSWNRAVPRGGAAVDPAGTGGAGRGAPNDCHRDDIDRACLVGIMDGYRNAIYQHDPKAVPPLATVET
jgi:hypothetical protein